MSGGSAPTTRRCAINADFSSLSPKSGIASISHSNNILLCAPDTGDTGGADGAPKKPRRRGSRGGRGRGRAAPAAAPAADAPAATPAVPKAAPRPRTRATTTRRKAPAVAAAPAAAPEKTIAPPAVQQTITFSPPPPAEKPVPQVIPPQSAPQQVAPIAQEPSAPVAPAPGAQPFTPGPPRVGMRPAVVRPATGGRMSFSKGTTTRHQFRPTGFRPPRAFTPETGPDTGPQTFPETSQKPRPEFSPTGQANAFSAGPPLEEYTDERAESRPPQQGPRGRSSVLRSRIIAAIVGIPTVATAVAVGTIGGMMAAANHLARTIRSKMRRARKGNRRLLRLVLTCDNRNRSIVHRSDRRSRRFQCSVPQGNSLTIH